MIPRIDLRLIDEAIEAAAAPQTPPPARPSVFSRLVVVPAGWPWDQTRAARLEASHGAPVPIVQLQLQLRRLAPWRSNEPARFAACYVRTEELTERLVETVEIEGRRVEVTFDPPEAAARRARLMLGVGLASALAAALLAMAVGGALSARFEAEERLSAMETELAAKMRRLQALQAAERESRLLASAQPGDDVGAALRALAWAGSARAPDARIEAWRWDHGAAAVEARGEDPPFMETGAARRDERPLRRGVYLWVIEPDAAGGRP